MKTSLQTMHFKEMIESPTARENVLRDELSRLPEVNLDGIDGFNEFCVACDRLKAVEQLRIKCESDLSNASEKMRGYIAKHWGAREIPIGVKSLLLVW